MKTIRKGLLLWIVIILFFMTLLYVYNQIDRRYIDLGQDAPIPTELHPIVEIKKEILLEKVSTLDIDMVITETIRSIEEQNQLYEQGRSKDGNIVTYAKGGESYHNYGLAIDFAIIDTNGNITWDTNYDGNDNGKSDWEEVAGVAKELGFEWGGDWKQFKDYPHLQMDFGLSIRQLQNGLRPREDLDYNETEQ
ncbi:M15 family metallopeptidase [Oceanobacillus halotolerans]|uniref:M15 family metallopeptidase n=1 Tax=Oceanobacillus halotolerans TaxID=2663380 RepID=UPI0013D95985|nr:M15 family metallopeptidase [Oceanobacillus halotolerans]